MSSLLGRGAHLLLLASLLIPVPPRPSKTDLVGSIAFFGLGASFVLLGPLGGGPGVTLLGMANGVVAGLWWAEYWKTRDAWRVWKRARRAEGESPSEES